MKLVPVGLEVKNLHLNFLFFVTKCSYCTDIADSFFCHLNIENQWYLDTVDLLSKYVDVPFLLQKTITTKINNKDRNSK